MLEFQSLALRLIALVTAHWWHGKYFFLITSVYIEASCAGSVVALLFDALTADCISQGNAKPEAPPRKNLRSPEN
jgi:hypothetical protein